jgi:hypothetical protein
VPREDDDLRAARILGSMLLVGGSITSIALSIMIASPEGEDDARLLLWGVLLGVIPLVLLGWSIRSRSTTALLIAAWACSAVLVALAVRRQPGGNGDLLVLLAAVYLAGAALLTSACIVRLRAARA